MGLATIDSSDCYYGLTESVERIENALDQITPGSGQQEELQAALALIQEAANLLEKIAT